MTFFEKPDVIITAIKGYTWEQIRPWAVSLVKSGFQGDKIVLASHLDAFTSDVLEEHGFIVIPVETTSEGYVAFNFQNSQRFVPLVKFLDENKDKYRYAIWVDARDLVFQSDPSKWLSTRGCPATLFSARECWRIKDEPRANDPWARMTTPDDWYWLREEEVLCSGTIAGDAPTMYSAMKQMHDMTSVRGPVFDQAAWCYIAHKPFNFHVEMPRMRDGWTVTCSAFYNESFRSHIGLAEHFLTDAVPVFDKKSGLVLTPDGSKPFAILHQYDRDRDWLNIISEKYRDF